VLFRLPTGQMPAGNPEHAFDAVGVAHRDLDMGLGVECCPWIGWLALGEDAAHGVERVALFLIHIVQLLKDRSIELAAQPVLVYRQLFPGVSQRGGQ
jgi:hypothetical protein